MRMDGHVAVVIGAAGGIGRAICETFAREGASVAAVDLDLERLGDLELGSRGAVFATDATAAGSLEQLRAQIADSLGDPTVLVNCVGIWDMKDYDVVTEDDWRRVLDGNLTSAWCSCQAFLPAMCGQGRGSVVNFASTAGEYGSIRPAAHYAAAKGGIIAMSKSLAREVSPHGVRVNVISPGPTETPMLAIQNDEERKQMASRTLVGRVGTPADMAEATVYLSGDGARFVTGHVLRVNGGSLI